MTAGKSFAVVTPAEKGGTLKDGTTVILDFKTGTPVTPARAIKITAGNAAEASIPASGGAGVYGSVLIVGFTK